MAESVDLFGAWREAMQRWEKDTNAALNAVAGDERYSRAMNQSLALMTRMQQAHAETVEQALSRANLPSRADFRALDARLDSLEAQLAELTAAVRQLAGGPDATGPAPTVPRPLRTRKPPSAAAVPAPTLEPAASAPRRTRKSPKDAAS